MNVIDVNPTVDGSLQRALGAVGNDAGCVLRVRPGPNGHGYPLVDWVLSPVPETCEREGLGLAIDYHGAAIPWDDVVSFARAHAGLPMILIGVSSDDGVIPAALEATPNLILELSTAFGGEPPAALIDRFGAHRFTESAGTIEVGAWQEANL